MDRLHSMLLALSVSLTACMVTACTSNSVNAESLNDGKYSSIPETEEIFNWAKDLVEMGARRPGTESGRKAQNYVKNQFENLGLEDIQILKSGTHLWDCTEYSLEAGGEKVPCYYVSHSLNNGSYGDFSTPEGGLEAELIYVRDGEEKDIKKLDVRGKIVVADINFTAFPVFGLRLVSKYFYDRDRTIPLFSKRSNPYISDNFPYNYFDCMNAGAAGFIGILRDYPESCQYNNEDLSYMGNSTMKIPGMWISKREGEKLLSKMEESTVPLKARMEMKGSCTEVEAGAVVGYLKGVSDEVIMVQSHYDSVTSGAVEDASGTSVLLAMAKYYAGLSPEQRPRTLAFVEMDTHFSAYDSHDVIIEKMLGKDSKVVANLCVEHIARDFQEAEDGSLYDTGLPEPRVFFFSGKKPFLKIVKEEIRKNDYTRSLILDANVFGDEVPTDAGMFNEVGVPIVNLISGPVYLYDNQDTLDKIDVEELRPSATVLSSILDRMMVLPKDQF